MKIEEFEVTEEFTRKRQGRNRAMLVALLALVALFFVISMVRVSAGL